MKQAVEMIDITWRGIFKVIAAIILFWIIYLLRSVIVWAVLALIISALFNPVIELLEKRKINRVSAAIIVYLGFLLICALLLMVTVPPLIAETQYFSSNFSEYFAKVPPFLSNLGLNSLEGISSLNSTLNDGLVKISGNIFHIFSSLFGSIFSGITIFVLAIYMSIEERDIIKGIRLVSPKQFEEEVLNRWQRSQYHVSAWFGSRVLSCIGVAIMTFLLCVFLKIKFALVLALLAGVLNIVPMIGPIISGLIVMAFAFFDSIPKLIVATIFLFIIQQIESNLLMPIFSKKMSGLPAVLVLLSILIGGVLGGIVGAILAIPFAGILFEGLRDYFNHRKNRE